uniref:Proteasome activator PA28 C-terminal domain-containing protein n=1 Tax=Aplanochytrium stocchinoi TaxID=215587 RepID=A0A7S3PIM3_9STRA|mmetsp:Transcript_17198/g.21181  ORF Transcript_17198/g.21181 Transcript_17198/m.21181 type:complete len:267 (-) Transcript_17198:958-1758(-)
MTMAEGGEAFLATQAVAGAAKGIASTKMDVDPHSTTGDRFSICEVAEKIKEEKYSHQDVMKDLKLFKSDIERDATTIVFESLPKKVLLLDKLFHQTEAGRLKAEYKVEPFPTPAVLPTGVIPVNSRIREIIDQIKAEICDMISDLSTLRAWIRLNTPKIEDGNNFGVEVQEEILTMLSRGRVSGLSVLQVVSKYYSRRAKLLSDMRKRPNIEEYASAAKDLDERQFIHLAQSVCDLRNNYALLYDKITKNKEKLVKPKSSHELAYF